MKKWFILGGMAVLVLLLYFLSYRRELVWLVNRATGIPLAPRVVEKEVGQISTNSIRAQFGGWTDDGRLRVSMKRPDGSPEQVEWALANDVSVECMEDTFKAPDGTIVRRSNMLVNYADGVQPERTIGRGVEWLKKNTKSGTVLWVFGDRTVNLAEVIYLFNDKCDQ